MAKKSEKQELTLRQLRYKNIDAYNAVVRELVNDFDLNDEEVLFEQDGKIYWDTVPVIRMVFDGDNFYDAEDEKYGVSNSEV